MRPRYVEGEHLTVGWLRKHLDALPSDHDGMPVMLMDDITCYLRHVSSLSILWTNEYGEELPDAHPMPPGAFRCLAVE